MSDRPDFDGTGLLDRELTALRDDVADRARLPDFAAVQARALRRRRTRIAAVGSVAAAAAVVVAIVLAPGLGALPEATPGPSTEGPTRVETGTVPKVVQDLVQDSRAHRFVVAGGLDGSVAVVWRNLVQPAPMFALVTRSADGVVTGQLLGEPPSTLTAVPGGWVGSVGHVGEPHYLVRPDGAVLDLPVSTLVDDPTAGDVAVPQPQQAGYLIFRDGTLLHPKDPPTTPFATYITPDGGLVAQSGRRDVVSDAGGRTRLPARTRYVAVVGNGPHVAAIAFGSEPDGDIPIVGAAVSSDSGLTWRAVALPDPFGGVSSFAITSGGTTAITFDSSTRFISPEGQLLSPSKQIDFEQVASAGDQVFGWSEAGLFVSTRTRPPRPLGARRRRRLPLSPTPRDAPMQRIGGRRRRVESSTPQYSIPGDPDDRRPAQSQRYDSRAGRGPAEQRCALGDRIGGPGRGRVPRPQHGDVHW